MLKISITSWTDFIPNTIAWSITLFTDCYLNHLQPKWTQKFKQLKMLVVKTFCLSADHMLSTHLASAISHWGSTWHWWMRTLWTGWSGSTPHMYPPAPPWHSSQYHWPACPVSSRQKTPQTHWQTASRNLMGQIAHVVTQEIQHRILVVSLSRNCWYHGVSPITAIDQSNHCTQDIIHLAYCFVCI